MAFDTSRVDVDHPEFLRRLEQEMRVAVTCFDIGALTRNGGRAADPQLLEIQQTQIDKHSITARILISLTDGAPIDCSGSCATPRLERTEKLNVTIDRASGGCSWQTTDGVISSES